MISYDQTDFNQIFFKNDDATPEFSHLCVEPHFFTLYICYICMDKQTIYLRFTVLDFFLRFSLFFKWLGQQISQTAIDSHKMPTQLHFSERGR